STNYKYLIMNNNNKIIIILEQNKLISLRDKLKVIQTEIYNKHDINIKIAIGTVENNLYHLKYSYEKASTVLGWIIMRENEFIKSFDEMNIELVLKGENKTNIDTYKKKIIGDMSDKDYKELLNIIKLFEKYNGSLIKISRKMFI